MRYECVNRPKPYRTIILLEGIWNGRDDDDDDRRDDGAPPPPRDDEDDDDRDGCGNGGGRRSVGSSSGSARRDGGDDGDGDDDDDDDEDDDDVVDFARLFENLAPGAMTTTPHRTRRGRRRRRRSGGIAPLPGALLVFCRPCLGGDDFFDSGDDRRHRPHHPHHRHQRRRDQTTTNNDDDDDDRLAQLAAEEAELACSVISNWANVPMATTGCTYYAMCSEYGVFDVLPCPDGTAFDSAAGGCDWIDSVACPTASPAIAVATDAPTGPPTPTPTPPATDAPTTDAPAAEEPTTDAPAGPPTRPPRASSTATAEPTLTMDVFDWMDGRSTELSERVFRSYTHDGTAYPSYWFQYGDFVDALRLVSASGNGDGGRSITGDERHVFYVGDGDIAAAAPAADGDVGRRRDAEAKRKF